MTPARRILASTFPLVVVAIVAPACSGSSGWKAPTVVRIESKEPVASMMPSWINWLSDSPEGQPQALLLRDGDLIFGPDAPFRYQASDGTSLKIEAEKWMVRVGQKIVTIGFNEQEGRDWLAKATDSQLKDLRLVGIPKDISADVHDLLGRLASANPSVDLMLESEAGLLETLPKFAPRSVFMPDDAKTASVGLLANEPQLETLLIKSDEAGGLDVLAKIPKLTRLVVGDWDPAKTGPLPTGMNSHLRSLIVAGGSAVKDLAGLKNVPTDLEELSVIDTKNLTDITGVSRFPHLTTLILNGSEGIGDLSGLSALKDLRWVGVPEKTTQEQFAAFVSAHADLAVLDLIGNKQITSLAPLASLTHLEGLILQGPYENMSAIHALKTLKFVGLSDKVWDASPEQVAALKAALPDAMVVRVSPFCLGSGWILLLAPALLIVWAVRRRTVRPAAA